MEEIHLLIYRPTIAFVGTSPERRALDIFRLKHFPVSPFTSSITFIFSPRSLSLTLPFSSYPVADSYSTTTTLLLILILPQLPPLIGDEAMDMLLHGQLGIQEDEAINDPDWVQDATMKLMATYRTTL
ncbi:hypothetical protein L2E82_10448 [Cichorium intybus]|uniref:Uncharacterized protein n=1 Tax=Cichorium intybus TaxID=13427 RepID=A0ACB9GAR1_CICIN|nr:hypothetical protein L2E82_10448 [Cichorium intybus]